MTCAGFVWVSLGDHHTLLANSVPPSAMRGWDWLLRPKRANRIRVRFFCCCSHPPSSSSHCSLRHAAACTGALQPARVPGSATQLALCVRSDPVCFVVPLLNWVSWACVRIALRVQSAHQHLQHLCPPQPAGNTLSPCSPQQPLHWSCIP